MTPWAYEAVQIEYSKEFDEMLHHISGAIRQTPNIENIAKKRFHRNKGVSREKAFRDSIIWKKKQLFMKNSITHE